MGRPPVMSCVRTQIELHGICPASTVAQFAAVLSKAVHVLIITVSTPRRLSGCCCCCCRIQVVRDYISSYSPLHSLSASRAADYPALLLTASLHDTRVNFW